MIQILSAILKALGVGAETAGTAGAGGGLSGVAGSLAGASGGAMGGSANAALGGSLFGGETLGAMAQPTGFLSGLTSFMKGASPDVYKLGSSVAKGDLKGVGGSLGNMMGGKNLGNMVRDPSLENLGKATGEMFNPAGGGGPFGGGGRQAQMPMPQTMSRGRTKQPESDDPIIKRMYQNLNPRQSGSGMKPWGQSPFPKKMSAI